MRRLGKLKFTRKYKKQVRPNEKVFDTGFVINFTKGSAKKIEEGVEDIGGIQVLNVEI